MTNPSLERSEFRFFHPIEVRYSDLDPQGHLNNSCYLTYFEQARVQYFVKLGLFKKDQSFMEIGVILAEAQVTFLSPIRFGQPIKAGVRSSKLGNKSITMKHNIVHVESGEVLATGRVIVVTFDYHEKKPIPIPDRMREAISTFEGLQTE